ncbi:MAG: hypothetical protein ICV78_26560 [Tolypothrix sp. Co-bin9]|nr:hypothetical protein [Tolypothrix sp. Co-bin9]
MSNTDLCTKILNFIVENGRVQQTDEGFDEISLIEEVKFEAQERNLSEQQIQECVNFAIYHSQLA